MKSEHVWIIYVRIGHYWISVRNTKVCASRRAALDYMEEEGMFADWYKPVRVSTPRERIQP